ncbi:type II toxin-antitoxin system VapC family toxin [Candidatus Woesearchaeota archaeon]|nr:type II toxin-antitoxin system VapC family toxin [Candidatus Woesearchaeota archaeon]
MYCLDTDFAIDFIRGESSAVKRLSLLQNMEADISITPLTLCELYKGAFMSVKPEEGLSFVNRFLESVNLLQHSKHSCLIFGRDYAFLKSRGLITQEIDLMIASICKENNNVLLTRNLKDFKNIPGLRLGDA